MSVPYVPVVVPPQVPSRQTQELADLLSQAISEYERKHSSITQAEIQQALALAAQRGTGVDRRMAAVAIGLTVALAVGVLAFVSGAGAGISSMLPWAEGGVVGLLLIVIVVMVVRRKP